MINFLNFCHQFKTLILVSVSAILKCVNVTLSVKRYRFSKLCIGATLLYANFDSKNQFTTYTFHCNKSI